MSVTDYDLQYEPNVALNSHLFATLILKLNASSARAFFHPVLPAITELT